MMVPFVKGQSLLLNTSVSKLPLFMTVKVASPGDPKPTSMVQMYKRKGL